MSAREGESYYMVCVVYVCSGPRVHAMYVRTSVQYASTRCCTDYIYIAHSSAHNRCPKSGGLGQKFGCCMLNGWGIDHVLWFRLMRCGREATTLFAFLPCCSNAPAPMITGSETREEARTRPFRDGWREASTLQLGSGAEFPNEKARGRPVKPGLHMQPCHLRLCVCLYGVRTTVTLSP